MIEYGKAKYCFYQYAKRKGRELGIEYIHLRIFSVYGPGDHPWTLVNRCLEAFRSGKDLELSECTQPWNFLYITDAAKAIAAVAKCDCRGLEVFNIAGEETKPLMEYVKEIHELCGSHGTPLYGQLNNTREKPHGIDPCIQRMKSITGWKQETSFRNGILSMI